jgi:hypothetical protein
MAALSPRAGSATPRARAIFRRMAVPALVDLPPGVTEDIYDGEKRGGNRLLVRVGPDGLPEAGLVFAPGSGRKWRLRMARAESGQSQPVGCAASSGGCWSPLGCPM